jgi:hypothetical protein
MGLHIRDDRQMKAFTGLSQAQFDHLWSVFRDVYQTPQRKTYEEGVASGTRRRKPGGGSKGKLPTMAEKFWKHKRDGHSDSRSPGAAISGVPPSWQQSTPSKAIKTRKEDFCRRTQRAFSADFRGQKMTHTFPHTLAEVRGT